MCGDFDDLEKIDEELFEQFAELAGTYGVSATVGSDNAPTQLADEQVRKAYMDGLFRAGLTRSLNDAANVPQGQRMDVLAGQAIVFARLAGFLAGQFPPETDLFRTISGALFDGHSEPVSLR